MMKIPKGGVFGGLVVALVISASIGATYLMNVESHQETAIEYDYITNISSLFDYDKNPQYYEYDLSKNYTGYYTTLTDPYWGGVDYTQSTRINNYRLNLAPTSSVSETKSLRDSTSPSWSDAQYGASIYTYIGPGEFDIRNDYTVSGGLKLLELESYLTELSLTGYDEIIMKPISDDYSDMILFVTGTELESNHGLIRYTLPEYSEHHQTYNTTQGVRNVTFAPLSAKYEKSTELVYLYSSPTVQDVSTLIRTVALDDCYIGFSTLSSTSANPYGYEIDLEEFVYPPIQYLDITKGVRVIGS